MYASNKTCLMHELSITKLREVQGLAHPTWSQSKIWPLLSPLLAFFDKGKVFSVLYVKTC